MTKLITLFLITLSTFSFSTSFSQGSADQDTTIQDALDFIKANVVQTNKASNQSGSNAFSEFFYTDDSYATGYKFEGEYTYTVLSATNCVLTFVESLSSKTKISFADDYKSLEETPIYSVFGYLNQDTIKIDFSKIARVESDKTSITLYAFNNMDLIEHNGMITQTPPKKRKNDLLVFFKEDEEDLYKKTKKYLNNNKMNYEVYPEKMETYSYSTSRFTFQNIDKEKIKRLHKAFYFLQQNCGAQKEKF